MEKLNMQIYCKPCIWSKKKIKLYYKNNFNHADIYGIFWKSSWLKTLPPVGYKYEGNKKLKNPTDFGSICNVSRGITELIIMYCVEGVIN